MNLLPRPQPCSGCENKFTGAVCPLCGTERAAYALLKRLTKTTHPGVQPLRDPSACKYYPDSICGCNGRATCLEAA